MFCIRKMEKNYRPISLLNVDYKISTRAISGRILGVSGSIISYDQTCGIPGRTISENLILMRDLIEYADRADIPLAILSLDQEKAFDRVDWSFLQRILVTFGYGDSFRQWISLFYTNVGSAVVINGWTSSFFSLLVVFAKAALFHPCCMCFASKCWHAASPHRLPSRVYLCLVRVLFLSALGMPMIHPLRLPRILRCRPPLIYTPSTNGHLGLS